MTDLETTTRSRREMLGLLGGLGAVVLVAGVDRDRQRVQRQCSLQTPTMSGDATCGYTAELAGVV